MAEEARELSLVEFASQTPVVDFERFRYLTPAGRPESWVNLDGLAFCMSRLGIIQNT